MKDPVHHRRAVQREILRSSRREVETGSLLNHAPAVLKETSILASAAQIDHDNRLDFDGKRKIPLHFVRPTSQRQHLH